MKHWIFTGILIVLFSMSCNKIHFVSDPLLQRDSLRQHEDFMRYYLFLHCGGGYSERIDMKPSAVIVDGGKLDIQGAYLRIRLPRIPTGPETFSLHNPYEGGQLQEDKAYMQLAGEPYFYPPCLSDTDTLYSCDGCGRVKIIRVMRGDSLTRITGLFEGKVQNDSARANIEGGIFKIEIPNGG